MQITETTTNEATRSLMPINGIDYINTQLHSTPSSPKYEQNIWFEYIKKIYLSYFFSFTILIIWIGNCSFDEEPLQNVQSIEFWGGGIINLENIADWSLLHIEPKQISLLALTFKTGGSDYPKNFYQQYYKSQHTPFSTFLSTIATRRPLALKAVAMKIPRVPPHTNTSYKSLPSRPDERKSLWIVETTSCGCCTTIIKIWRSQKHPENLY